MSDFTPGVGHTDRMCLLPSSSDSVLQRTVADSQPMVPIRVMFERLIAGMTRMEARMDDYDRRPPSVTHTSRPEPDPPYSRPLPRSLEVVMPYAPPFSAVNVSTTHLPATAPFLNMYEGFRPNPNGASGSMRSRDAQRLVQPEPQSPWDLPPTSRAPSAWDLPPTSRAPPHGICLPRRAYPQHGMLGVIVSAITTLTEDSRRGTH